jgi:hypothetical protein
MAANPKQPTGHTNPITDAVTDTLRIVSDVHREAEEIVQSATETIKRCYGDPKRLGECIENLDTPVYLLKFTIISRICLKLLGYSTGFVPPANHWRYRLLQRFLGFQGRLPGVRPLAIAHRETSFEHGVFVLLPSLFTISFLSYQLHHWLACRSGMSGYDERAQGLYREFWDEKQGRLGSEVEQMTLEDVLALKAAINRDMEALCFLRNVMHNVVIPASQGKRLSSHGNASA